MKTVNRKLIAVAVFALGLTAAPSRAADVEKLLPAETEQVFQLNIKQILESDLVKKYALAQIKQALAGNEAQKTLQALGMDPLKDIDSLTGGVWGEDPKDLKAVIIVRGKFDAEKLFDAAKAAAKKDGDKVSIVTEGDYTLVKVTVENRPEPLYLTVADDKTVLLATDKKLVVTAMKAADDKSAKPQLKKDLIALIEQMDGKASMFACGVSSGKVGEIPPNPLFDDVEKLKKQLEKLKSSAMTLRVTTDVAVEVIMSMKDGDAAEDFGSTVDELLGKAKAFLPFIAMQNANMKPIIGDLTKSLKSKVDKNDVKMTLKLTGDSIGKAAGTDD